MNRVLIASLVSALAFAGVASADPTTTKPSKPLPKHKADPAAKPADKTSDKPTDKPADKKAEPEVTLKVGDKAPDVQIDAWVKGTPVSSVTDGKVYVVEFWATWCPPCRESIPHLTELQKKHKNELTIIGVAASEREPKNKPGKPETGKPEAAKPDAAKEDARLVALKKFVADQDSKMAYTVGYDSDRQMAMSWMRAAGRNSIPTSFVVGHDGKIAWIGNPLDAGFDGAVEKAVKDAAVAGPKTPTKPST